MLSNSSLSSKNRNRSMSQARWPASAHDLEVFHGSNKPPLLLFKISLIGERQAGICLLERIQRVCRWRFALGMEMSLQRGGLLSARGAPIHNQMTGYGESGSRSRKGLDELSSC